MEHSPQVNEILLLGMETKVLMKYIETGDKNYYLCALAGKLAITLVNIWK